MENIKLNIKKGDNVLILSGKDKGKRGKVLRVVPKDRKAVVEGVAVAKRHTKPTQKIRQGGVMEKPLPIPICKMMLICPHCARPTRIRRAVEEGKRIRRCRKCGETIDK